MFGLGKAGNFCRILNESNESMPKVEEATTEFDFKLLSILTVFRLRLGSPILGAILERVFVFEPISIETSSKSSRNKCVKS